ncbi:NADH-quinone oxidoreductase subunit NuoE [Desulfovibrio inopinatus]|uniref:NADH-quinone oxidoreductase subunit NuoE n=1 Tax=Desulfovibrio inopinatus TaxID=102109 RepID=UPI000410DAEE|nr:NADH-quinone oxidoreductase subunit NuoE [Desulfovibrio inopinatus]
MLPEDLEQRLQDMVAAAEFSREKIVDVMYVLQNHFGYLTDSAVRHTARLTGVTPVEVEELATFYDFIYRQSVGRYVIHVCDGVVCWMHHEKNIFGHLCDRLGVGIGETTPDGLFTVLPTACLGDCHNAPALLINGKFYGPLTPEKVDAILQELREKAEDDPMAMCR